MRAYHCLRAEVAANRMLGNDSLKGQRLFIFTYKSRQLIPQHRTQIPQLYEIQPPQALFYITHERLRPAKRPRALSLGEAGILPDRSQQLDQDLMFSSIKCSCHDAALVEPLHTI